MTLYADLEAKETADRAEERPPPGHLATHDSSWRVPASPSDDLASVYAFAWERSVPLLHGGRRCESPRLPRRDHIVSA